MAVVTSDDCTGLMAFWADIDDDYVLKYQRWHNCEHVPERVSIPGFIEGRRYRALDDQPRFLMFYDTQTASILASDAYFAALNRPTLWTKEALTHFRNPTRDIFSRLAIAGTRGTFTAPYITSLRFDLPEGIIDQYINEWVPEVAKQKNVDRVRLYEADSAVANAATSERKVHGGGPGKQRYLVLIEEFLPPATDKSNTITSTDAAVGGGRQRQSEECTRYWLEIAHTKKEI